MTISQMLTALPVVQKIMGLKLPIKKAYKAYSLAKVINDKRDFFINEEKKLIDKFEATILDNGNIQFKSEESQKAFIEEHNELLNYVVEDAEVLDLSFEDLGTAEFTPVEVGQLEGVVNFID